MQCPQCGFQNEASDRFCRSCGAALGAAPQGQAGAQLPGQVPPQGPVPPQPPGQAGPAWSPQYQAPPPPPARQGQGLLIAGIAVAVVVVLGIGVGAALYLTRDGDTTDGGGSTVVAPPGSVPSGTGSQSTPSDEAGSDAESADSFATPEDAIESVLPEGWVYTVAEDGADSKEYWVGPPQSEYSDAYTVQRQADGSWTVSGPEPLDYGEEIAEESEAQDVVAQFLQAVMEDRADDAQALTVPPFSEDPASASFGGGDFTDYEIEGVEVVGESSWLVYTREVWYGDASRWRYTVVRTPEGEYRISDLAPMPE